ncbi:Bromodomain-containing protein [Venturia nashicola]|uniref:Bromodomain-containing protein n=1 Tax=Venturia nashicola TaxID=86259 RepID=A0A4Z1P7L7_9PEZI|nr:Bromodomain-containing protein [Venturia nashicola]
MASETPLDPMSFNEKAHPSTMPSEPLLVDGELNGSTNHFDALFDDAPPTTNGTHPDETTNHTQDDTSTSPIASKTITAGDPTIAPITDVTSGIAPVAPFLPMENGDSLPDASDAIEASISQAVEQPESNLRAEPPAQYQAPVEESVGDPDAMDMSQEEVSAGGADLPAVGEPVIETISESIPTETPVAPARSPAPAAIEETSEAPAAQSPVDQAMASPSDQTMFMGNSTTETVAPEAPVDGTPITGPLAFGASSTDDKMDTAEDIAVPTPVAPMQEPPVAEETALTADEPVPTTEIAPEPDVPSVEPLSIEHAQTGQVRSREEDDEAGPAPKRARTETGEEALPTPAAENTAPLTQDSASVLAPATSATSAAPVGTSSPTNSKPPSVHLDSNPMTVVQHKFLLTNLRKAKKVKSAEWFLKPVDAVALNIPTYYDTITQPMDLGTLEQKLKERVYNTANDFMADFELIVSNSAKFNGDTHPVTYAASNFKAYFVKVMKPIPKGAAAVAPPPVAAPPKKPAAAPKPPRERERKVVAKSPVDKPAGYLNEHGMPIIRRDSSAHNNDRPKREIHPPKRDLPASGPRPKKKKHQLELKFCQHVLNELTKKKHQAFAYPFMVPVDPVALNIPNYHKVIKKPMDFGTIQSNLAASQYAKAKEFYDDATLVFQNCFKFNPPTDEVNKMGKMLQSVFDQTWATKENWLLDNAPASEPQSEDDEEEEDEEEEVEDTSDAVRRMQEIQQQIAALSAEALKLTAAPKRASPKASVPKRSKTSKPKRPSGTGHAAPSKPSKSKTVKKPKKLTLDQKREVSDGIAALDESQMRKAVQIIRNGVPHLRNVQDDELELDIDEIPDDVTYQLYQFVKAKLPRSQRAPDPEPDYEDDDDEFEAPIKAASSNRKKNKPMKANEQEERIRTLQAQLEKFKGGSGSEQSPPDQAEDSSDDDASESSEEE